ncbi:hypothetical protein MCOR25_004969 [Pyricularia grisea]|uniref:EngB-type G domain-containing protein n=1 Tax=Pyricularia grisea TaxID=148305 RepID=A0A6P8AVF0_PYRGI|nr:uncharacterized protein PgNI_08479 [Pyricularia grisea]KAI6367235.1 hypothetical protein MCOR25_004969 [Pyricularia grisea]TLD06144.1 hypothetical protein PgNI_08479 [Pyricularia grisea]
MLTRLPRHGLRHAVFILPARPGGVCFFTQSATAYQTSQQQISESPKEPPVLSKSDSNEPVPYVSFQPGPSNIPGAPLAIPTKWLASQIRAADKLVLYRKDERSRPAFLYSARRFLELPRNSLVPEICLLGRSNVGKSTMINAIAGVSPGKTGSVDKTMAKKGLGDGISGFAVTSRKAGCTQTLNCYGFGPPPSAKLRGCMTLDPKWLGNGTAVREILGGRSRSALRHDAKERAKNRETHNHSLYVMDMPGYGHNSKEEWGHEIVKYIQKRKMLRGAVLLIDAAAGFKEGDRVTLQLLRDANIRTTVVLTKGNKPTLAFDPAVQSAEDLGNDHPIVKVCAQVWEELRRTEREVPQDKWTEGDGWDREIFVTAAHSSQEGRNKDVAAFGLSGVRLAICDMAGRVSDVKALPSIKAPSETNPATPSKIVSFDDIMWASTTLPESGQGLNQPPTNPDPDFDPFEAAFGDIVEPEAGVTKRKKGKKKAKAPAGNDAFTWGDEPEEPAPKKSSRKSAKPKSAKSKSGKSKSKSKKGRSTSRDVTPVDSFDAAFLGAMATSKVKPKKGFKPTASF